jgi:hypothetical protein
MSSKGVMAKNDIILASTEKVPDPRPIYVRLLNAGGKTTKIYAFVGNETTQINVPDLTTDTMETSLVSCAEYIHWDDSIVQIRNKIIRHINASEDRDLLPHDTYLFTCVRENIDTLAIYQSITRQRDSIDIPISRDQMYQLLLNMCMEVSEDSLRLSYTYEEMLSYTTTVDGKIVYPFSNNEFILSVPLGRELIDRNHKKPVRDFTFAANPYKRVQRTESGAYIWRDRGVNTLLMSYKTLVNDTLYLCLSDTPLSPPSTMQSYYPDAPPSAALRGYSPLENSIDFLYELSFSGALGVPTTATIQELSVTIKSPYNIILPLDTVFGYLHATTQIPFVQYNPGRTHESIIRLRSIYKTFQGESIPTIEPILLEKIIEDLSKKYDTITMYLPPVNDSEIPVAMYVILGKNADIQFKISATDKRKWIPSASVEDFITKICNPVLDVLNDSVQQLGFSFSEVQKPLPTSVIVSDIKYTVSYEPVVHSNTIDTGKFANVFNNLFVRKQYEVTNIIRSDDIYYYSRGGGDNTRQALLEYHLYQCNELGISTADLQKKYRVDMDKVNPRKMLIRPVTLSVKREQRGEFSWTVTNISSLMMLDTIQLYLTGLHKCLRGEIGETNEIYKKYFPVLNATQLYWTIDARDEPVNIMVDEDIEAEDIDDDDDEDIDVVVEDDVYEEEEENPFPLMGDEDEDEEDEYGMEYYKGGDYKGGDYKGGNRAKIMAENEAKNREAYHALESNFPSKKGVQMKNANGYFNIRRKRLDYDLFYNSDDSGRFITKCQASMERQPLPLTDEEYEQNKESFKDEMHLQYGTKNMHYVCPPHYCLPKNMPMTDEDVDAGKCMGLKNPDTGEIMPDKTFSDNFLPRDAFVHSFKQRAEKKGLYPAIIWDDDVDPGHKDPKNSGVCCFTMNRAKNKGAKSKNAEIQPAKTVKRVAEPAVAAQSKYGPNKDLSKMNTGDFAQLVPNVQLFMQMNVLDVIEDDNIFNVAVKPQLFRFRVENGSFLGCIADIVSYMKISAQKQKNVPPTPPLSQFVKELTDKITLDDFIKYQNGSLVAQFRPKQLYEVDVNEYRDTEFYKSFQKKDGSIDDTHVDFLEETVISFIDFKKYLNDNPQMEHTFLWDIAVKNPLYPENKSINIIILDVNHDSITNKVDIICPTSSHHDAFRPELLTLILLKMGENQYEPIYQMEKVAKSEPKFVKLFDQHTSNRHIRRLLWIVSKISKNMCRPVESSTFRRNIPALDIYTKLRKTTNFNTIIGQIQNYQQQIIGLLIRTLVVGDGEEGQINTLPIFVPCYPSPIIHTTTVPVIRMDADITENRPMWSDYKTTFDTLSQIAKDTGIPCKPKIINVQRDNVGDFVVGILTETNQFVKVSPPLPETDLGEVPDDVMVKYEELDSENPRLADYMATDIALSTAASKKDVERLSLIQEKIIDRDYFALFRKLVRDKFNVSLDKRSEVKQIISDKSNITYPEKLRKIRGILEKLCENTISFQETADDIWKLCATNPSDVKCKVMLVNGKIVVPTRKGEIMKTQERYYMRIADELLRYGHMRQVMLLPQTRLVPREEDVRFIAGAEEMVTNAAELKSQTEARIDFYKKTGSTIGNMNQVDVGHALPIGVQNPADKFVPSVSLAQQQKIVLDKELVKATDTKSRVKELIAGCEPLEFSYKDSIIGNNETSYWKQKFPADTFEITTTGHKNNILTLILYDKSGRVIDMSNIKDNLREVTTKEMTEKYPIKPPKQYDNLTELDLFVFAQTYHIPICIFTSIGFQNTTGIPRDTLVCLYRGEEEEQKYYFLRTLSDNRGARYLNLLYPPQNIPAGVEVQYIE